MDYVRAQAQGAKLADLADLFVVVYNALEGYSAVKAELEKAADHLRFNRLPEIMASENVSTFKTTEGHRITLQSDMHATLPVEYRPVAHEWLRDTGHGDLIVESVNASTLKAFIKRAVLAGENAEFPTVKKDGADVPVFSYTPYTRAQLTRAVKKAAPGEQQ